MIDFNDWRQSYDTMTYEDQKRFYAKVERLYPVQIHYTKSQFFHLFKWLKRVRPEGVSVLELGGWRGELASDVLGEDSFGVRSWVNYEIAPLEPACTDTRYQALIPDDFLWNLELPSADVFLSSHCIEHVKGRDLIMLIERIDTSIIAFESPLLETGHEWVDYPGSHILEIGWEEISRMVHARGYKNLFAKENFRSWAKDSIFPY